jgi:hypothetical protein
MIRQRIIKNDAGGLIRGIPKDLRLAPTSLLGEVEGGPEIADLSA